mgnify:CR=1 FL=1
MKSCPNKSVISLPPGKPRRTPPPAKPRPSPASPTPFLAPRPLPDPLYNPWLYVASTTPLEMTMTTQAPTPFSGFHRVLVRKSGAPRHTTVSLTDEQFQTALKLAYGNPALVRAAVRQAALTVPATRAYDFSAAVRKKALASLRGAYRPEVARAMANNSAWEQI